MPAILDCVRAYATLGEICDDYRLVALNHSDAGHQPGARRFIAVHPIRGKGAEFEERRVGIDNGVDPLADKHLAAFFVALDGGFTTTLLNGLDPGSKVRDQLLHG